MTGCRRTSALAELGKFRRIEASLVEASLGKQAGRQAGRQAVWRADNQ